MGVTLDEAIMRFKSNAEYEREHGSPAYLESEQLCKWLKELKYSGSTKLKCLYREEE